jgi:Rad3-related DNA helicase
MRLLPRRKIPDVLPHQQAAMVSYAREAADRPDVAIQLPTGSGKTLVGLLIAEWRRRRGNERAVYLCPTRQLVNQVTEQAEEKYGLSVLPFTGSARKFDAADKAAYRNGDQIAVTTYSSLFNTNPFFSDADVIVVDDAHAAESYMSAMWSLQIDRTKKEHSAVHSAMCGILKKHIRASNFTRLRGTVIGSADRAWVDKLPTPIFHTIRDEIIEVLDAYSKTNPSEELGCILINGRQIS